MYLVIYKDHNNELRIVECATLEVALIELRLNGGWIIKTVDLVEKKV